MHARTFAAVSAAFLTAACSPDGPTTPTTAPRIPPIGEATGDKQQPAPTSAVLSLCQAAGAGVSSGQTFTSAITLAGVTRSVATPTGGCLQLEVPRESTPQKKGWFQSTPTEVARLLPGAATLRIDGANLARADVQAILGSLPNVQASSSLLLNLAQQVIAAELNVLRGVQPSSQMMQAITDANAAIRITLGSQIIVASTLSTSELSALVTTLTAFNEGKTRPPAPPASASLDILETFGSQIEVASIGCEPATSCDGTNLVVGRVTTTVTSGGTTTVTYTNQSKPILRVCAAAGTGIANGTMFHLDATSPGLALLSFDVPTGECREAEAEAADVSYDVAETRVAGVGVGSIDCDQFRCTFFNYGLRSVSAYVPRGTTTVTFTNRTTLGTLALCVAAGTGIATGTQFSLSADNSSLSPITGESTSALEKVATGDCVEKTLLEGQGYEVREFDDFVGRTLSSITCSPALRCGSEDLDRHLVLADIVGGSTTTVTFTNRSTLGTIRVCVQPTAGIPLTAQFLIDVSPYAVLAGTGEPTMASPSVPVGQCRDATLKEGTYTVSETLVGPTFVSDNIACDPSTRCSGFFPSSVKAEVVAASTTQVTFTNALSDSGVPEGSRVRSP